MVKILPFLKEDNGIVREWHDHEDGTYSVVTKQHNETQILERNKAMFNHNDGYTPSRDMQRVASIPLAIIEEYMSRGINLYRPEHEPELRRLLNDSDYRHLRTAAGYIGPKHKHV